MRYAVVIEKGKKNYGVYCPDVPGCVSVGDSVDECLTNIHEALQIHFDGMREDGDAIPDPVSLVDYVDVPVTANRECAIPLNKPSARAANKFRNRAHGALAKR